jgi:hypothetical protein
MKQPEPVKIERNVPRPFRTSTGFSQWGEALAKMKIDDSFVYTGKSVSNMYIYAKCRGLKISAHKNDDGTFRIWRVA